MVTVVSATPKQLDSVGAWHTMMPSSVAASVSMSSTPTVYFATPRSRCGAWLMRRLTGAGRPRDRGVLLVRGGQFQVGVADAAPAPEPLQRLDGLRRLLARGKDQDF